jgi:hypothetical protein
VFHVFQTVEHFTVFFKIDFLVFFVYIPYIKETKIMLLFVFLSSALFADFAVQPQAPKVFSEMVQIGSQIEKKKQDFLLGVESSRLLVHIETGKKIHILGAQRPYNVERDVKRAFKKAHHDVKDIIGMQTFWGAKALNAKALKRFFPAFSAGAYALYKYLSSRPDGSLSDEQRTAKINENSTNGDKKNQSDGNSTTLKEAVKIGFISGFTSGQIAPKTIDGLYDFLLFSSLTLIAEEFTDPVFQTWNAFFLSWAAFSRAKKAESNHVVLIVADELAVKVENQLIAWGYDLAEET